MYNAMMTNIFSAVLVLQLFLRWHFTWHTTMYSYLCTDATVQFETPRVDPLVIQVRTERQMSGSHSSTRVSSTGPISAITDLTFDSRSPWNGALKLYIYILNLFNYKYGSKYEIHETTRGTWEINHRYKFGLPRFTWIDECRLIGCRKSDARAKKR